MPKTKCPIERAQFSNDAKSVEMLINGTKVMADPKQFSTGSFGWYFSGKVSVEVNGKQLPVQVGCNLTVVGSKNLP